MIKEAVKAVYNLSEDDLLRERVRRREEAIFNEQFTLHAVREAGREEGEAIGIEKGKIEKTFKMIKRFNLNEKEELRYLYDELLSENNELTEKSFNNLVSEVKNKMAEINNNI